MQRRSGVIATPSNAVSLQEEERYPNRDEEDEVFRSFPEVEVVVLRLVVVAFAV